MSSSISTSVAGQTSRGYMSVVTFSSATAIQLFGSAVGAGLPIPRGEHQLTLTTGTWVSTSGAVTAYPAGGDSASITLIDVEKGGVQQTLVQDFSGFSYVSTAPITDTQPLLMALSSQNGSTTFFTLNRFSTVAASSPSAFTLSLTQPSYATGNVFTMCVVTSNDLGTPLLGMPSSQLYHLFEGVNTSASVTGAGDWVANAETPRTLGYVQKGAGAISTSSTGGDPVQLVTIPTLAYTLYNAAKTAAPYVPTIAGFSLAAGVYRIRWRLTGYGVGSFVSYLRAVTSPVAPGDYTLSPVSDPATALANVFMGTPEYSSSTSTDSNSQSWGEVTVTVTSGTGGAAAVFGLFGACASTSYINGKGLSAGFGSSGNVSTTINTTGALYTLAANMTEKFSDVWIQVLS